MQGMTARCPCCNRPLGISWDMWGRYYLCGGCGFTAEDDDDVHGIPAMPASPPAPGLTRIEAYRLGQTADRK